MFRFAQRLFFFGALAISPLACGDDEASDPNEPGEDGGSGGNTEQCLADCGEGCPAEEFQICASDGERYCNECVVECYGLTVEEDACGTTEPATDAGEPDTSVEECVQECGVGCPAPEFQICASDGERYCNECVVECHGLTAEDDSACSAADAGAGDAGGSSGVEECVQECGVGCPAPEFQICASDGERYCNECVVECHGLTAEDDSACGGSDAGAGDAGGSSSVEECVLECGAGCPAPEFQICASDGERYCSECVVECHGLTPEADSVCEADAGASMDAGAADAGGDAGATDAGIADGG